MLKPDGKFVRSYALDLLVELNDQPHINKEQLFADAMSFYRWQFSYKNALEALPLYESEFGMQHGKLLAARPLMIKVACFITWFVEGRFHEMAPLVTKYPDDEIFQRLRFSSPCFILPTGDPMETYLIQWIYWFLDHQPAPNNGICNDERWAYELVSCLVDDYLIELEAYTRLLANSARFFRWCWSARPDWEAIVALLVGFLRSDAARPIDQHAYQLADAAFINWFCAHNLDQSPAVPADDADTDEAASA